VVIGDFMKEGATDFKHVSVKADVRPSLPFLKSNTNCVRGVNQTSFLGAHVGDDKNNDLN
jgi:hypothetical protein